MINNEAKMKFVTPHYSDKDIMHDMWHIKLLKRQVDKIISSSNYEVDYECLILALYLHGFIYKDQQEISGWLAAQAYDAAEIAKIIKISWESQRNEVPETIEGKILHDAHILEGGKTYTVVKTLITGSLRGRSLVDTLNYMKEKVLDQNKCYLPETIPLCEEMNIFTHEFYVDLMNGIE